MNENDDFLEEDELQEMQQKKQQKKSFWNNKKTVKGKALSAWLVIIIVIFMLVTFGLGMFLGKKLFENKNDGNNSNNSNSNTIVEEQNNDKEQQEKINLFIQSALYSNSAGDGIADKFIRGYSSLTDDDKAIITYNSVINVKKLNAVVNEIPEKYKSEEDFWTGSIITKVPIATFKNEYNYYFKENLTSLNDGLYLGCPMIYKYDEELGNIYFTNQCGGIASPIYKYSTFNNSQDDSYYYVDQYVGVERTKADGTLEFVKPSTGEIVNVTSFEGNEDKFDKIQWKFDKNVNFISTEIME